MKRPMVATAEPNLAGWETRPRMVKRAGDWTLEPTILDIKKAHQQVSKSNISSIADGRRRVK